MIEKIAIKTKRSNNVTMIATILTYREVLEFLEPKRYKKARNQATPTVTNSKANRQVRLSGHLSQIIVHVPHSSQIGMTFTPLADHTTAGYLKISQPKANVVTIVQGQVVIETILKVCNNPKTLDDEVVVLFTNQGLPK